MAEDLNILIPRVGAPIAGGNVRSADPVRDVQNRTTQQAVKAQQTIDMQQMDVADEMRLLQQKALETNQNTRRAIDETKMRYQQAAQSEQARIQDDTTNLRRQQEVLQANFDGRMEEHKNTVANGNYSFFANPITYIRDQYRINYQTQRLNDLAAAIRGVNSRVDSEYAEGAQRLMELRQGSFAMDYMAIVQDHRAKMDTLQVKQMSAAHEYQRNGEVRKAIMDTQALTQQLIADPRGPDGAKKDEMLDAIGRFMYVLNNPKGTIDGYDTTKHREAMVAIYEAMPQEQKTQLMRNFGGFTIMDKAGQTMTNDEIIMTAATNKDFQAMFSLLPLSNSPDAQQLQRITAREFTTVAEGVLQQLVAEDISKMSPEEAATAKTEGLPAARMQQLRQQAYELTSNNRGGDVMQQYLNRQGKRIRTVVEASPIATMTSVSSEALGLMEQNMPQGIDYNELQYFNSDDFKQLQMTASDPSRVKLYGQFGTILMDLQAGLERNGAKKENIPAIIATYVRSATLANQLQDPSAGPDIALLMKLGLDSDIPIQATALQEGTGIWNALFGRYNGPEFDAVRGRVDDMTDPADVQQALELLRQYEKVQAAGFGDVVVQALGVTSQKLRGIPTPLGPSAGALYGDAAGVGGLAAQEGQRRATAALNTVDRATSELHLQMERKRLSAMDPTDPERPAVEARIAELKKRAEGTSDATMRQRFFEKL